MARKPNSMYRHITQHAYTRRKFIGGVPMSRIQQFELGDRVRLFPVRVELIATERGQVRHVSMEAARIALARYLEKYCGRGNFHAKFRIYPHHVLRENKQATGAGADRVSLGMRASFGKPVGTAARVEIDRPLVEVGVEAKDFQKAKTALRKASYKFPLPCRVHVRDGAELIK